MRTVAIICAVATAAMVDRKHKHHKHGAVAAPVKPEEAAPAKEQADVAPASVTGRLLVMGPLPTDFGAVFAHAVSQATACEESAVHVIKTHVVNQAEVPEGKSGATALISVQAYDIVEVLFEAPEDVVKAVVEQAADPKSKLASGELAAFLAEKEPAKAKEKGVSFDTEMPYGQLEPFGREDTATELTRDSIKQSNAMVDQLEKAEVAEERRSVFRALTRLRGAAISSFDGIARSQTGNVDEYALTHQWRNTHPLHHLASEEGDVKTWAFPDAADLLQTKTN